MNTYSDSIKEQETPLVEEPDSSSGTQAEGERQEPEIPATPVPPVPSYQAFPGIAVAPTFFGTPQSPSTWPGYYAGARPPWVSPPTRKRSPWPWFILALSLLFLLVFGAALFVIGGLGLNVAGYANSVTETRTFTVAPNPTLVLNNDTGSIHVRGLAGSKQVAIQATRHSGPWGNVKDITVGYAQNSVANSITVTVNRISSGWYNATSVDFDITVPSVAGLQLKSNTGSIDVSGVSGLLVLTSNTGSVSASNGAASGNTELRTDTGSITFDGSIAATGSYLFQTHTGSVNVTLPAQSAFHLMASTDTGSITTTFPGVTVQHSEVAGADAQGDVGLSPQATVSMTTNTGSINLWKR
jgi:hypothetical protein